MNKRNGIHVSRSRAYTMAILMLLVVGSVRLGMLALSDPVIGYANNWDMQRLMNCLGVSPRDVSRAESTPTRTLQYYTLDGKLDLPQCLWSSQLVLLVPSMLLLKIRELLVHERMFDLRVIGIGQAVILLMAALVVCRYFLKRGALGIALMNALVFAIIVADPMNALYLNGFYPELAALFFTWLAIAIGFAAYSQGVTKVNSVAFALTIALLAVSKRQYLPLAVILGALEVVLICRATGRLARGFAIVVLLGVSLAFVGDRYIYGRESPLIIAINRANAMDAIMGAVLPLTSDKDRALATLGLPPACRETVGKWWYTPGIVEDNPCPEVYTLSKQQVLALLGAEPVLLIRLTQGAVTQLSQKTPIGLLVVNLAKDETGDRLLTRIPSLAHLMRGLSATQWGLFVLAPLLVQLFALVRLGLSKKGRDDLLVLCLICAVGFYATFYVSILGDGWAEFVKHNHMTFNFLYVLGLSVVLGVISLLSTGFRQVKQRYFR